MAGGQKLLQTMPISQSQVSEDMGAQEKSNKDLEAAYRVKKRTIDLLPNAEQNLTRLQVGIM